MKGQLLYGVRWFINLILMSTWFAEFVDPAIRLIATLAGLVLTIVLIRKALIDTELAREQKREKKLSNDLKDQELWDKVQTNKQKYG